MKMNSRRCLAVGLAVGLAIAGSADSVTVSVDLAHPGHAVPESLYGLFIEDISMSVDGGFYPELVWNRGFDFPSDVTPGQKGAVDIIQGWTDDCRNGSAARITLQYREPLHPDTPAYLRIEAYAADAGTSNIGAMNEMSVRGGVPLTLSLYARGRDGYTGGVAVALEDEASNALARVVLDDVTPSWRQKTAELVPSADCRHARLRLATTASGTLELEQVSLMPKTRFKGRANGLRADIGQLFADLKPATFRFPGGCLLEGNSFASWWDWKRSVGDGSLESRQPLWNTWGYWQTLGLGFYEYLLLCEDLGAEPVPVFLAGLTCQHRVPIEAPMSATDVFARNVLDGIEFIRGGVETKWGALRAKMGHPAPFLLKYVGIGNENWGPEFFDRYDLIFKAVKAAHPDLLVISDADPRMLRDPKTAAYAWTRMTPQTADIVDEHLYSCPSWWLNNVHRYDSYDRKGCRIYVGEWASRQASDPYINSLYCAVAESAFRMGFEKNADVVCMTAFAPLIRRVGVKGNRYSLIQLDGLDSCGAPSYYAEKMFALNRPARIVPVAYPELKCIQPAGIDRPRFFANPKSEAIEVVSFHATAGLSADGREIIVKCVNASAEALSVSLDFGVGLPWQTVRRTTLAGAPDATNLPTDPHRVVPRDDTVAFDGGQSLAVSLPACSLTIFRIARDR